MGSREEGDGSQHEGQPGAALGGSVSDRSFSALGADKRHLMHESERLGPRPTPPDSNPDLQTWTQPQSLTPT